MQREADMSETDFEARSPAGDDSFRGDDDRISAAWIGALRADMAAGDTVALAARVKPLHVSELGDLIEALEPDERLALVSSLGEDFDYSALTEVDEQVRLELLDLLPNTQIARGVANIDSDDAVYLLEDLEQVDRDAILAELPAFERLSLRRSLDFPEDSAGRRMQTEFIAIPPFWTVGQTIDYLRVEKRTARRIFPDLRGRCCLSRPRHPAARQASAHHPPDPHRDHHEDRRRADRCAGRPGGCGAGLRALRSGGGRRHRREQAARRGADGRRHSRRHSGRAGEDIRLLAGVGDEEVSDTTLQTVRGRAPWLLVNLVAAVLVSFVIGLFNATIEQMVALAVLMPIVASMGGNAGAQAMTVTVRALAMRELEGRRLRRLITREMVVGLANGVIFAVLIGLVTFVRYSNVDLGAVIALAMIVNLIVAGACGVLTPLALNRFGADPAIASAVFVTTITDVVGFFAFLALAGWWFGLF
jgi:magnesium transporter